MNHKRFCTVAQLNQQISLEYKEEVGSHALSLLLQWKIRPQALSSALRVSGHAQQHRTRFPSEPLALSAHSQLHLSWLGQNLGPWNAADGFRMAVLFAGGAAGGTCGSPEQAGWMLGSCWPVTGEILQGVKGLIPADASKGECCPFVVNVNVKENTRESLLVVRARQHNHNK